MRIRRFVPALALFPLLTSLLLAAPPRAATAQEGACFAETGFCARGRFLAYWTANGGLTINGFPLSDERRETLEDGNEYTVQYFERARLEYHPENLAPYDVLLGQFGRRIYAGTVSNPLPAIDERFRGYWEANGGLAQFGYPISGSYPEQLADGTIYTVQYFERARFELHPENRAPDDLLLGQFGRQVLAENALVAEPFRALFIARRAVGRPLAAATVTPATYLPFERGALLYQADTRTIHLFGLIPGTDGGDHATFPDTWDPGQPVGGGAGPTPGLYEPARGFGTLWRAHPEVRAQLGYATATAETGYTLTAQTFQTVPVSRAGVTLYTRPDGRTAYAANQATYYLLPLR